MDSTSFDAMDKMGQPDVAPVAEDIAEYIIRIAFDAEGTSSNNIFTAGVEEGVEFVRDDVGFPVGMHFGLRTARQLVSASPDGIHVERARTCNLCRRWFICTIVSPDHSC